ncbi:MAG: beta-ketoacyl synthase N-terminal-like domain-containing protein [Nostoc sp.]|uniref:beta-ketoacyl synthase N-terminal-like domain-containing protein n=1 Tax=Nostoc sp. TaxID=1180 RepID=UPI002FF5FDBC
MNADLSNTDSSSLMKKALLELRELRAKLSEQERSESEAIAVVGMGCKFPGGANSPEAFWELLHNGVDAIREVPGDRWKIEDYYDPNPNIPGKMYTRSAGFVDDVDLFDPLFFGISPREAVSMDPQQRLLLEVCWQALENAAIVPETLKHSLTGIFVGLCTDDYAQLTVNAGDQCANLDAYSYLGVTRSIATGRIAYVLGLQGPNIQLDTACSSSLVGLHLASQSLRNRECNLALAGGVNLMLSPTNTIGLCRLQALAPDGHCKTFDASANGMARGEGCGIVVLKRLGDAIADGNRILGLIRGSAINHDGASSGLTVPNETAQVTLIQEALNRAKVRPEAISYVEAHGTGTALGDPIELEALKTVYNLSHSPQNPLIVGSVKTNIGHLEAAAGIAGFIKVILSLQNQEIPPHLHFQEPNPHVNWDKLPIRIPTQSVAWERGEKPRLAGLSSFGLSGTNAHVILEEATFSIKNLKLKIKNEDAIERSLHLLTLSAKTQAGLEQLIQNYYQHLKNHSHLALADICFTANTGRSLFEYRASFIAESTQHLQEQLANSEITQVSDRGRSVVPRIAFLFTGQGSQYPGMGKELYDTQPTFRQALQRCAEILQSLLDVPLLDILYPSSEKDADLINQTVYTQPAIFALEYALFTLWQAWGIQPNWVMGHSVGEYVGATVAGVWSLEEGLTLIAHRGRLMQSTDAGAMVVVFADIATVRDAIAPYKNSLAIAAINGLQNIVVSGDQDSIGQLIATFNNHGIKTILLRVSHGFHSSLMTPIISAFRDFAQKINYQVPKINLVSNLTGNPITEEIATPEYWCQHIQKPVQFAASLQTLFDKRVEVFIEIGAKPTLLGMASQNLPEVDILLPTLRPGVADWQQILTSLNTLFLYKIPINWFGFDQDYHRNIIDLPTYPWQKKRYWSVTEATEKIERKSSQITTLLDASNREKLTQLLLQNLSADKQSVITEIVNILVDQHQAESFVSFAFPQPAKLKAALQPQLDALIEHSDLNYWQVLDQLETLTSEYILRAFYDMGCDFEVQQRFSTTEIAAKLGIVEQHYRLLVRLLEMLREVQVLELVNNDWEVINKPDYPYPQDLQRKLLHQCPQANAELIVVERCGSNLIPVLRGECDPLQSLFPAADLTLATQLYQDAPFSQVMNTLLQKTMISVLDEFSQKTNLRILEIGAGTGGTTAYLLPHLDPQKTQYTFTDISPFFTTKAAQKFQDYPFVGYQVLNIEKDPRSQKFPRHYYQIIIAANVIHATADLRQTLTHIHDLLAPGGLLVMLETTARQRWVDLFAGFTGGWWKFTDFDIRPNHPLLSAPRWEELLQKIGFETTATMQPYLNNQLLIAQPAVIIAQSQWMETSLLDSWENPVASVTATPKVKSIPIREQLATVSPQQRHDLLVAYLQDQLRLVLGLERSQIPDPQQGFFDLGLDSLTAVELKNRLEADLNTVLSSTLAFDFPNIQVLASYLAQTVFGWTDNDATTPTPSPESVFAVVQLDENELEALIAQEVAGIEQLLRDK